MARSKDTTSATGPKTGIYVRLDPQTDQKLRLMQAKTAKHLETLGLPHAKPTLCDLVTHLVKAGIRAETEDPRSLL